MGIIQTHDITLHGGTDNYDITLRPLNDEHLPLLYKWNADPDVLYWTEGGEDIERSYGEETVHAIFGGVSKTALCFLIEANGEPIGECWLQKMNLSNVIAMYPGSTDVRRIDMAIGEKKMWGKGIGTAVIKMLVDYAFHGEYVEILHCFNEDYNPRARRVWEKLGFKLILSEDLPQPQKGKQQHHFRLTRQDFIEQRRVNVPSGKISEMPIINLQPSQLYISEGKLRLARCWFNPADKSIFDPITIKMHNNRHMMTDGHTRAALAFLSGWEAVPVTWDEDELDIPVYTECVRWCDEAGIKSAADLVDRIISAKDYAILWNKRCNDLYKANKENVKLERL